MPGQCKMHTSVRKHTLKNPKLIQQKHIHKNIAANRKKFNKTMIWLAINHQNQKEPITTNNKTKLNSKADIYIDTNKC